MFWVFFVPYAGAVAIWLVGGASPDVGNPGIRIAGDYFFSACNVAVALFVLRARPRDRLARLLAVGMLGTAATFNRQSHSFFTNEVLGPPLLVEDLHTLLHVVSGIAYLFAVIAFPDERLPPEVPRRWQSAKVAVYVLAALQVAVLTSDNRGAGHPGQGFFLRFFAIAVPLVGVIAQTTKLRTLERDSDRRVARLLRAALVPLLVAGTLFVAAGVDESVGSAVFPALFAFVPVALVVAILRYRLLDIEVVVRRTLVYATLVALLGAAYVAIVVFVGSAVGAAAIVALAFDPLRRRLQVAANHLVFGRRLAPYEAIAALAQALSGVATADDVLPRIAEGAAVAVGATGARATVTLPDGTEHVADWGQVGSSSREVMVRDDSGPIGGIEVHLATSDALDAAAARVLDQLATQAAPALVAVRADAALRDEIAALSRQAQELRASRRRLASAGNDARREVARAIDTRVMPQLEAVADALASTRPDVTAARTAATGALEALRELAHGVFPPVLADQGLAAALQSVSLGRPVTIAGWRALRGRRLPATVESGAYFCVVQAMADAEGPLRVRLGLDDDRLSFRIEGALRATGRTLVADRVAALGGRLVVDRRGLHADLPLTQPLAV